MARKKKKTGDPADMMTAWTLHDIYGEPGWHLAFRAFCPRDKWPECMKGETDDPWPECLPDGPEKDACRDGLERARRLWEGRGPVDVPRPSGEEQVTNDNQGGQP